MAENIESNIEEDDEPWYWCASCKSPKIKDVFGLMYCADCNGADIMQGSIEDWEKEYYEKYHQHYKQTKHNDNGRYS